MHVSILEMINRIFRDFPKHRNADLHSCHFTVVQADVDFPVKAGLLTWDDTITVALHTVCDAVHSSDTPGGPISFSMRDRNTLLSTLAECQVCHRMDIVYCERFQLHKYGSGCAFWPGFLSIHCLQQLLFIMLEKNKMWLLNRCLLLDFMLQLILCFQSISILLFGRLLLGCILVYEIVPMHWGGNLFSSTHRNLEYCTGFLNALLLTLMGLFCQQFRYSGVPRLSHFEFSRHTCLPKISL